MVHRVEEPADVELESSAGSRVVLTFLTCELSQTVNSGMGALPDSAGVAIKDERPVKKRVQNSIHRMVHQPVTNRRLVNNPMFWVEDVKAMIGTMPVLSVHEVHLERKHIIFQVTLKLLHVLPPSFTTTKFSPSKKKDSLMK